MGEAEAELVNALSDVADRLDLPVVMRLRHYLALAKLQLGRGREAIADLEQADRGPYTGLGGPTRKPKRTRTLLSRARTFWTIRLNRHYCQQVKLTTEKTMNR